LKQEWFALRVRLRYFFILPRLTFFCFSYELAPKKHIMREREREREREK
jgi:hypothetical protein